ncbi:MAG TPA: hypothetical protein VJ883_04435 [Woeseiaceae bacterium]|nr:hypothetical protein [Woeseiaceae bacterium]
MKKTFLLGLLLGVGGAVWLAGWYPLVDPVRFPSESGVARNGGRTEGFRIQIPEDRVLRAAAVSAATPTVPPGVSLPAGTGDGEAEIYKLRNDSGKVIGLASRVAGGGDAPYTDWTLMLPARGALFLSAADADTSPAAAPAGADAPPPLLGDVAGGSGEFSGIGGSFREEWAVTGRDADGRLVGEIEIMTLTQIGGETP